MYNVIKYFTDLQDHNRAYNVGDKFPREGLEVSQKRLDELASSNNRQGTPLIKKIVERKPTKVASVPVEEAKVEEKPVKRSKTRRKKED